MPCITRIFIFKIINNQLKSIIAKWEWQLMSIFVKKYFEWNENVRLNDSKHWIEKVKNYHFQIACFKIWLKLNFKQYFNCYFTTNVLIHVAMFFLLFLSFKSLCQWEAFQRDRHPESVPDKAAAKKNLTSSYPGRMPPIGEAFTLHLGNNMRIVEGDIMLTKFVPFF